MKFLAGRRPNALLTQTFFDAKADEIQQIFSGGPMVNTSSLVQILNKVAPIHADKWQRIKPVKGICAPKEIIIFEAD